MSIEPRCPECGYTIQDALTHWDHWRCKGKIPGYETPVPPPITEQPDQDLNECPKCGGPADNGHDRCLPPSPYYCTKCMVNEQLIWFCHNELQDFEVTPCPISFLVIPPS